MQKVPSHISWNMQFLKPWLQSDPEPFFEPSDCPEQRLSVDVNESCDVVQRRMLDSLEALYRTHPDARKFPVKWNIPVSGNSGQDSCYGEPINLGWLINILWDGLRTLPYSNVDLGIGMAHLLALLQKVLHGSTEVTRICDDVFGPSMEIDIGAADGSGCRAHASISGLESALRPDIKTFFPGESIQIALLLQAAPVPASLFEFSKLASLWGQQIAPSQVLRYKKDFVKFYSPARATILGLP